MPNTLFGGASINSARGYIYILHIFLKNVKGKHDFVNIKVFSFACGSTGNLNSFYSVSHPYAIATKNPIKCQKNDLTKQGKILIIGV
jgi:hypothetical protein